MLASRCVSRCATSMSKEKSPPRSWHELLFAQSPETTHQYVQQRERDFMRHRSHYPLIYGKLTFGLVSSLLESIKGTSIGRNNCPLFLKDFKKRSEVNEEERSTRLWKHWCRATSAGVFFILLFIQDTNWRKGLFCCHVSKNWTVLLSKTRFVCIYFVWEKINVLHLWVDIISKYVVC